MALDDALRSLLDDPRAFAMLGTVAPSGYAQVNPMWIDREGDRICFNSALGRAKVRQLAADPRATVTLVSMDDPYAYRQLQGTVEAITGPEAEAHIDRLARKYLGEDYPYREDGEERIKYVFTPVRSSGM